MKSSLPFPWPVRSHHLLDLLDRMIFAVFFLAGLAPLLKAAIQSVRHLFSY